MLMVAPTGRTNRVTRLFTPMFSSRQRKVMGRVAELQGEETASETQWFGSSCQKMGEPEDKEDLDDVPRAVMRACSSPPMNL